MKKNIFSWQLPLIVLATISLIYYWRILAGKVPFPGDLLIGAYLPWLEYKWGNVVGVAIKNTLISDIFSQFFLWKNEIGRNYAMGQWPLWNPYSYSGYPLLANFNSGALNPLNILFVIFGSINGWSMFVYVQTLGSALAMYYFLRTCKRETLSAYLGAVVYAFGGFSILWSQFVNVGVTMIWIPLILNSIELTYLKKDNKYLLPIAPLLFLIVLAGHLQALVYTAVITVCYFVYRLGIRNISYNISFFILGMLAIGMSMIQLLPTIELMGLSIRFADKFVDGINNGLLPLRNLITLVAPDFFGNPSTGNHWGFFDYHETMTYVSMLGLVGLSYAIFNFKKLAQGKFFAIVALVALLMQFDTPLGQAIYTYKFPFLYTSVAGRINMILLLSASILVAEFADNVKNLNFKSKLLTFIPIFGAIFAFGIISYGYLKLNWDISWLGRVSAKNINTGMRNLAIPGLLSGAIFMIVLLSNKFKHWKVLLLLVLMADVFRFGWKYIPFVPKNYIYPETEVTKFLKGDKGVYRIEKELGEIMPQNTWTAYQFMSPSGYDPMALTSYTKAFSKDINFVQNPGVTRFSEINTYNAGALGKYNVKYLLAIKRDKEAKLGGDYLNHNINIKEWKKVFETKMVAVLENTKYQERARVVFANGKQASGSAKISSYTNNRIVVDFENNNGDELLLADTFYPGWIAKIDGAKANISDKTVPFRTVDIKGKKSGQVVFEYKPKSFYNGLLISIISLFSWTVWLIISRKST